jgi:hypothetical protein
MHRQQHQSEKNESSHGRGKLLSKQGSRKPEAGSRKQEETGDRRQETGDRE